MWGLKKKEDKFKYRDFEYKVIEKKRANGDSYFIGQSTARGGVTMLTSYPVPYRAAMETYGYPEKRRAVPEPTYMLVDVESADIHRRIGGTNYSYSEFNDPCRVKEIICKVRADAVTKRENLSYRKVVSEGKCPC